MLNTSNRWKVELVGLVPPGIGNQVQLTLRRAEPTGSVQPIPQNEDERRMIKGFEAMSKNMPWMQGMGNQWGHPSTIIMMSMEEYRASGSPGIGELVSVSVRIEKGQRDDV